MLLRFVRVMNALYAPVILGIYLVAFLAAFTSMFFFPPAAILLVIVGVLGLFFFWTLGALMRGLERWLDPSTGDPDSDGGGSESVDD
ncbi:MAG: hypothetical protein EXS00_07135 [Phycisphaerales bacterium]|nr:hypothetical protein [Phycisphaerales bacterium]